MQEQITLREATKDDYDFVCDSWVRHFGNSSEFARLIPYKIYNKEQRKVISHILQRPDTNVLVAAVKESPLTIAGYIVSEKNTIHWIHTRRSLRKFGLAKFLIKLMQLDPNECQFTHRSHDMNWIQPKFPDLLYNPYRLLRSQDEMENRTSVIQGRHGTELSRERDEFNR